ncbi:MAG: ribosome biogenesis factor YjgA [Enterobacteriaceae bacterium]
MQHNNDEWQDVTDDADDEIIWVSKSELKRDAESLKALGVELVELSSAALDRIPLSTDMRDAIELAQRIKKEGRRRQLQFIGKLLRQIDIEPIQSALDKLKNRHNQQVAQFHQLESLRDRLLQQGDEALNQVVQLFPAADRQKLRSLVRAAHKEQASGKPAKNYRQLFQYLRELQEQGTEDR